MRVCDKPKEEENDLTNFKPTFISKKTKGDAIMKEAAKDTVQLSFEDDAMPQAELTAQTSQPKLKFGRRKKVVKETV